MTKNKLNMKEEAANANTAEVDERITDQMLFDLCPKVMLAMFKKAKTPAARADFLFELDRGALKEARAAFKRLDEFAGKLEAWFLETLVGDQTGVTGTLGRVEVKLKEIAAVEDWDKFYGHIKKKGEFELLNRAVNQKSVQERWEAGKEVPGITKFTTRKLSLTSVKK